MVAPCKECQQRYPACHDQCPLYKQYRAGLDEVNDRRKAARRVDSGIAQVQQKARDIWAHNNRRR